MLPLKNNFKKFLKIEKKYFFIKKPTIKRITSSIENHKQQQNSIQKKGEDHSLSVGDFNSGMLSRQKETVLIIITATEIEARMRAKNEESGCSIKFHIFLCVGFKGFFSSLTILQPSLSQKFDQTSSFS